MAELESSTNQWESQLLDLLRDLTSAQDEMLSLLARKRKVMVEGDRGEMVRLEPEENQLCDRLLDCQKRRGALLEEASKQGKPNGSLRQLAAALPGGRSAELSKLIEDSATRIRLLQHESLSNWVVAQKAVLHVAHIIEILATGGKLKPTYGEEDNSLMRGNLIDQEA